MAVFGANHVDGRRTHERLVVHELAHQWFGNSLTVADWRHIWLNEGFATYAEWLWSETLRRALGRRARAGVARGGRRAARGPRAGGSRASRMFDPLVYKRGALTLHALRLRVGDERFFALLRAWVAEHRHGSVTDRAVPRHGGGGGFRAVGRVGVSEGSSVVAVTRGSAPHPVPPLVGPCSTVDRSP